MPHFRFVELEREAIVFVVVVAACFLTLLKLKNGQIDGVYVLFEECRSKKALFTMFFTPRTPKTTVFTVFFLLVAKPRYSQCFVASS